MTAGTKTTGFQAEVMWFCPLCTRLLAPEDEVGQVKQPTQAEWAEHFDGEILRMPTVEVPDGR